MAIVRFHGRNKETWEAKGLKSAAERFNYLYSEAELHELATHVKELAENAQETHALYTDQIGSRDDLMPTALLPIMYRSVLGIQFLLRGLAIMSLKISNVYLFLAVDPNGDESVPAFSEGDLFMPLVATAPARVDELRAIAKQISRESGQRITLCRFSVREDLEVIDARH
jgi:uncharacterized protein YecE (DUF72 family)